MKVNPEELERLDTRFKDAYEKFALAKIELDGIKQELKDIALEETLETSVFKVGHYTKEKIDYKTFVVDSQVKVPDTYRSTVTETRITYKKPKK